jgi:hypothetical protein
LVSYLLSVRLRKCSETNPLARRKLMPELFCKLMLFPQEEKALRDEFGLRADVGDKTQDIISMYLLSCYCISIYTSPKNLSSFLLHQALIYTPIYLQN